MSFYFGYGQKCPGIVRVVPVDESNYVFTRVPRHQAIIQDSLIVIQTNDLLATFNTGTGKLISRLYMEGIKPDSIVRNIISLNSDKDYLFRDTAAVSNLLRDTSLRILQPVIFKKEIINFSFRGNKIFAFIQIGSPYYSDSLQQHRILGFETILIETDTGFNILKIYSITAGEINKLNLNLSGGLCFTSDTSFLYPASVVVDSMSDSKPGFPDVYVIGLNSHTKNAVVISRTKIPMDSVAWKFSISGDKLFLTQHGMNNMLHNFPVSAHSINSGIFICNGSEIRKFPELSLVYTFAADKKGLVSSFTISEKYIHLIAIQKKKSGSVYIVYSYDRLKRNLKRVVKTGLLSQFSPGVFSGNNLYYIGKSAAAVHLFKMLLNGTTN